MEAKLQQQAPQKVQANKPNLTGIPTQMKLDFEQRSGLSFDDVRVHYNSDKPAQLQALAYTQGTQVYVGPGQERHLPHELGHVVQQKLGYVSVTDTINSIPFNLDASLECNADYVQMLQNPNTTSKKKHTTNPIKYAPIQCRLDITYSDGSGLWSILSDTRPVFSDSISPFLNDILTPAQLDFAEARSKDHIISYETINKILKEILFMRLNGTAPTFYDRKKVANKDSSVDIHKSNRELYDLIRMIIPKQHDNIVLHNLIEFSLIKKRAREKESTIKTTTSRDRIRKEILELDSKKYLELLDQQRKKAFHLAYSINSIFNDPSNTVDTEIVNALANDLEFLLNSSLGNLRLGDSSTNRSIRSHIDPLYGGFGEVEKLPKSSSAYKLDIDGTSNEYVAEGRKSDEKGEMEEVGDNIKFESGKRSMAKRILKLLRIMQTLKNRGQEVDIPAFFVNKESGGTPIVSTSDYNVGIKADKNKIAPQITVSYIKRDKSTGESKKVSCSVSTNISDKEPYKGYVFFEQSTIMQNPDEKYTTKSGSPPMAPESIDTTAEILSDGITITLYDSKDPTIISIDTTKKRAASFEDRKRTAPKLDGTAGSKYSPKKPLHEEA